jgi:pimeloyl-ACP methyl ester carboxylesterase
LVVLASISAMLSTPSPVPAAPPVPELTWHPCANPDQKGFGCATARVPLDYRHPGESMIRLAVIRHRATDPAHRLGSLFINPGGPGGSGTALMPSLYRSLPAALRARFDIVSWDPRGVGKSTAVQCFASRRAENRFFGPLLAPDSSFPVGKAQMSRWIGRSREFGRRCAARNGRLLEHVSTADTARDLDLLRRAVGDRWMSYIGASYGTFLGATYANLFPDRARAMVLDGAVNPTAWVRRGPKAKGGRFLPTHLRQRSDQGAAKTLRAFLDLCGRAGVARCAFSAGSAAATRSKFTALLARLPRQPGKGSYAALVSATIAGLYSAPGWSQWAQELQDVWTEKEREPEPPPTPLFLASNEWAPSAQRAVRASGRYAGFEQQAAIFCSESPNPPPAAYGALDAFASRRSGVVGPPWTWLDQACASWPAHAAERYAGPWDRRTAHPILVIGTTHDPATPYQSAVALSHQLARARLLTVDGYGHTAGPSTCAQRYGTRYLISGTLPARGARCAQDRAPFSG